MRLIRAEFENFRLLRDLRLDFSTDSEKKLTVIRAENESGKTTILKGLQWALYDDEALPGKGTNFRLSPIDWNVSTKQSMPIPISVQVDFEITNLRRSRKGDLIETIRQYRIIRSAYETLDGKGHKRTPSTVKLFELTDKGSQPITPPEAWIHKELPIELREIFFTDGDKTLSFIEATADATIKRKRVQKAIRSLLGLGVIKNALKHVKNTASEFNKDVKNIESDTELTRIATQLNQLDKEMEDLEEKKKDANLQFDRLDQSLLRIDKKIEQALIKGDREKLNRELKQTQSQLRQIDNDLTETSKEHAQLFENLSLSRDLLAPVLEKSLKKLDELRDQGKLPSTAVPVLEEHLKNTTCICGESLDPDDPDGKERRKRIHHLIEESRKPDAFQNRLAVLYFGSDLLRPKKLTDADHWTAQYAKIADRRDELEQLREEPGKNFKALEAQLDTIPNTDIQGLRDKKRQKREQRDRFNADQAKYETQLEGLEEERRSLVAKRNNHLRHQRRGKRTLAKFEVTKDVESVLKASYDRITNQELNKVSTLMNKTFLEMIGADPEQGAIIQKAKISEKFDILVYGPNGRPLNPDQDLNGASRRALTLAFILALTKVSEVKAPNVIDTPLGMMSGYVKQSVLKIAIRESSQLILFLTDSEIAGCEEILDTEAGQVITLTNTAHYPEILVNDPQVKEQKVLRCKCNHRRECPICLRRIDMETDIESIS